MQCVLQQIIPENFMSDGSFLAEFGDSIVTGELCGIIRIPN